MSVLCYSNNYFQSGKDFCMSHPISPAVPRTNESPVRRKQPRVYVEITNTKFKQSVDLLIAGLIGAL